MASCVDCIYGMFGALCQEIKRVVSNATIYISKLSIWASICIYICCRKLVGRVSNLRSKWLHALVISGGGNCLVIFKKTVNKLPDDVIWELVYCFFNIECNFAILETPSYFQFYVAKQFSFNYRTFYKYYSIYLGLYIDFSNFPNYCVWPVFWIIYFSNSSFLRGFHIVSTDFFFSAKFV